jgi:hypothetical protein
MCSLMSAFGGDDRLTDLEWLINEYDDEEYVVIFINDFDRVVAAISDEYAEELIVNWLLAKGWEEIKE